VSRGEKRQGTADDAGAPERADGGGGQKTQPRRESSAGGIVYRMDEGRPLFLLIRDSYGNWGFPKGHVEPGERADVAALREVKEETGLRSLRILGSVATIEWFFRFRGALVHKTCEFFLMESGNATTKPQKAEGITDCRWTTADEALALIVYENARGVLRAAVAMLASQNAGSVARTS
jgi:8-oxo-dGTP pyrophosphatase MutT (NUDIX family)